MDGSKVSRVTATEFCRLGDLKNRGKLNTVLGVWKFNGQGPPMPAEGHFLLDNRRWKNNARLCF